MHLSRSEKSIHTYLKPERASETQARNALGFIILSISQCIYCSVKKKNSGVRRSIATGNRRCFRDCSVENSLQRTFWKTTISWYLMLLVTMHFPDPLEASTICQHASDETAKIIIHPIVGNPIPRNSHVLYLDINQKDKCTGQKTAIYELSLSENLKMKHNFSRGVPQSY